MSLEIKEIELTRLSEEGRITDREFNKSLDDLGLTFTKGLSHKWLPHDRRTQAGSWPSNELERHLGFAIGNDAAGKWLRWRLSLDEIEKFNAMSRKAYRKRAR